MIIGLWCHLTYNSREAWHKWDDTWNSYNGKVLFSQTYHSFSNGVFLWYMCYVRLWLVINLSINNSIMSSDEGVPNLSCRSCTESWLLRTSTQGPDIWTLAPPHVLAPRLINSLMKLRPWQGNLRLVSRLFSLMRGLPSIRLKPDYLVLCEACRA